MKCFWDITTYVLSFICIIILYATTTENPFLLSYLGPLVFLLPKLLQYLAFQSFDFDGTKLRTVFVSATEHGSSAGE